MASDTMTLASLLWGTVCLRPYVFIFLLAFMAAAFRDLGPRRTLGFLLWAWGVAFVAEYASTRVGVPFGLYHSNVPLFDSLSFAFLAYAAFCVSRVALGTARGVVVVALSGILMMLLDLVMDPLAVRGERWFLGHVFYYPAGGAYFGVPLSNFAGWAVVGWLIVGGYAVATRRSAQASEGYARSPGPGVALYYGVLLFNLAVTFWIREGMLLAAGIVVHIVGFLLLYRLGALVAPGPVPLGPSAELIPGGVGRHL